MTITNRLDLIKFSKKLVNLAQQRNVDIRLFGSVAVDIVCHYPIPNNKKFKDIDLVGNIKQREEIINLLELFTVQFKDPVYSKNGWHYFFKGAKEQFGQDIYFDAYFGELTFNHKILPPYFDSEFKFTIPLTQLLVTKLAIVNLTSKDIKAILNLLYYHEIANDYSVNKIQLSYLQKTWTDGWRGWETSQTCSDNLQHIRELISKCNTDFAKNINLKIDTLLTFKNRVRKNCCWRARNAVGKKLKHFKEPD